MWFLLGEEPESELHCHGSVHSSRLSAGQGGRTELHAQTQGTVYIVLQHFVSMNTDQYQCLIFLYSASWLILFFPRIRRTM